MGEALREVSRVTARAERTARRARAPVAVGLGLITPLLGPFGPITAAAAGILAARVGIRSAKEAAKAAKIFELEQERFLRSGLQVPPGIFGSFGTATPAAGGFGSFLTGLLSQVGKVALPVAQQVGGALLQRELSRIVGVPRAPTRTPAFIPGVAGPLAGRLAQQFAQRVGRATPRPPIPFDFPQIGGRLPPPRAPLTLPGGFITHGANIPAFTQGMPAGSQRMRPVLLADGSVGFVLQKGRRRMNVLNPRALNRAIRRVDGFAKSVMRSRKALRRIKTV